MQLPATAASPHLVVVDELVHAAWAQRGAHGVDHGHACVDVADQLRLALAGVCALPQQDDLRLLRTAQHFLGVRSAARATGVLLGVAGGALGRTIIPGIIALARPKGASLVCGQSSKPPCQPLRSRW